MEGEKKWEGEKGLRKRKRTLYAGIKRINEWGEILKAGLEEEDDLARLG
jgi:hypothetical protein